MRSDCKSARTEIPELLNTNPKEHRIREYDKTGNLRDSPKTKSENNQKSKIVHFLLKQSDNGKMYYSAQQQCVQIPIWTDRLY